MATVYIDSCNTALLNIQHYEDISKLKQILACYNQLYLLAENGDTVAASIYVDLKIVLFESELLTAVQKKTVVDYFIYGYNIVELAQRYGRDTSTIHQNINKGVLKLQKALLSGTAHRTGGGGN